MMTTITKNVTTSTTGSSTCTILTIPSSNGILDANYLRNILITTTSILSSEDDVVIENSDDHDEKDENLISSLSSSLTTISLWISPLNTLIIFLPERERVVVGDAAAAATTTVWTAPALLVKELHSSTIIDTITGGDVDTENDDNDVTTGTGSYMIQFPSNGHRMMIISNMISLLSTSSRRHRHIVCKNIIQQIQSVVAFQKNNQRIGYHPDSESSSSQPPPTQPELIDIPLYTTTNCTTKNPSDNTTDSITNTQNSVEHNEVSPIPKQQSIFPSLESKILTIHPQQQQQQQSDDKQSLSTSLSYQPLTLNSHTPIPFETDLFRGQMIIILRPSNDPAIEDPFWYERIFRIKKRRCIITVQGQFKYVPQGILYAGAEVSQPMKLGLVIKGICTILLKLVERFNSNIHSSFGTTNHQDENQQEAAHIVAPAYTFYERLVVTPPNEPPPSILDEIIESPESIQLRKGCTSLSAQPKIWNTTDTYTFSFYSMYIDLPTWQLVGLPASGDIGLQTFWGSSLLRICMYDKTNGLSQKQHILAKNRYAFSIQLEYLGKNGEKKKLQQHQSQNTMESPKSTRKISEDYTINENSDRGGNNRNDIFHTDRRLRHNLIQHQSYQVLRHSESQLFLHETSSCDESMDENNDDDDDDLPFFDAKESHASFPDENTESLLKSTLSIVQTKPVPTIDHKLIHQLSIMDQYCPYWIELCILSRNGSSLQYVTAFACCMRFSSTVVTTFRLESECNNLLDGNVDNNTSMSTVEAIDAAMQRFSSRISSLEKMRRCIGLAIADADGTTFSNSSKMIAFCGDSSTANSYDNDFLSSTKIKPSTSNLVRWSGFIARAYSDRHWVEEWVCLHERHITFRHLERRKSSEFVLLVSNIIGVEKLNQDLCPYNNKYPILSVSTLTSTLYLMFSSDSVLESWCQMIDPSLLQQQMNKLSNAANNKVIDSIGAAADDLLHKSSLWNCKNRRILNCGSYCFRVNRTNIESSNPLTMAEHALRQATEIATSGVENCTEKQLYDFMRSAAMLKQAYVSGMDEVSRLAFYLNVYHTMISHAYLVLGPPDSSLKWINYFNNIAYQVGDDIFSLTELEHSIIRANMSYPTQFLSRFIIPKSAYPSFALTISDCRINFALNCGSLSNPSKIILYQPQQLNQQLDEASRLYLLNSVTHRRTGSGDLELKLPRICQWFADDFGPTRPDLLSAIESYLPFDVQRQLDGCRLSSAGGQQQTRPNRFDMSSIIIRYHSYNFECRPLSIL